MIFFLEMTSLFEKESFLSYEKSDEASPDPVIPFECMTLFPGGKKCGKFHIFDVFATILCFLFSNIGLWRGAFGILYHNFDLYELSVIYLIGSFMNVYFLVMKDSYDKYLNKRTFSHTVIRILYMYTTEMGLVFHWAGLWFTMDYFIGLRMQDLVFSSVCSGIVLLFLDCLVNTLTSPFTVLQIHRECISRFKNFMCAEEFSFSYTNLKMMPRESGGTCSGVSEYELLLFNFKMFFSVLLMSALMPFVYSFIKGFYFTYKKSSRRNINLLDHVLSALVVAPAVVCYWRGTWILSDLYLFPDNYDVSMFSSLVVGCLGQLIFTCFQNYFTDNVNPGNNRIVYYVISRGYTYVFGAVCVNLWRGIWNALDLFSGQDIIKVLIPTLTSFGFLIMSRTLRNISSSPFFVAVDLAEGYFAIPTMFKLMGSKVDSLFILDALFSVFVVGCLVVFVWRGVWCIFDIYLYPNDEVFSAIISLILGYATVLIVFSIQNFMTKWCSKLTGFWRLVVLDVYIIVSFIGTINVWRGIWNLINIYFLPESPSLSCWISHFGGFLFLVVINCSNTLLVRGVAVDGEEEGRKCAVFPISFLTVLCKGSDRKETEEADQTVKSKNDVTL